MSRLVGIWIALEAATVFASPPGRVERIERSGASAGSAPRLCEIRGDAGTCVGEEPRVGQTVVMVDERHPAAEVQIIEATSVVPSCANLWSVKTRTLRGSEAAGSGIGVIAAGVHPGRAHVLDRGHTPPSPSGHPAEDVWRAIDGDGDGRADLVITRYNCDPAGRAVASGPTYCIDVWSRTAPELGSAAAPMTRTTRLNFAQCNL